MSALKRFKDEAGREFVSIDLTKHRSFGRACLDVWATREGRQLHHLLRTSKSISVPADLLDEARAKLQPNEIPDGVGN